MVWSEGGQYGRAVSQTHARHWATNLRDSPASEKSHVSHGLFLISAPTASASLNKGLHHQDRIGSRR